jgi:enoyl-CoA hydratase/carnithine racemase
MTTRPAVRIERVRSTVILTLDREERMNAAGEQMRSELRDVYADLKHDRSARAMIITGAGDRAFCVGQDVKETLERGSVRPAGEQQHTIYTPLAQDLWLPCIVAVNGVCVGGGLHFVADADIVLASREHASFADTHVSVGQVATLEPTSLLGRVDFGSLSKMVMLGRHLRIGAKEALRINLVDEVVPHEQLLERACELADQIAQNSPAAVEASKRALVAASRGPYEKYIEQGWEALQAHWGHPDVLEGARAFAEKRTPQWSDRGTDDRSAS